MVTVEALQTMMTNLQAQAHQNMVTLAQQHLDALKEIVHSNTRGGSSGMTDTRGIGRPVVFKGEEQRYGEWKAKLFAFHTVDFVGRKPGEHDRRGAHRGGLPEREPGGDQLWESAVRDPPQLHRGRPFQHLLQCGRRTGSRQCAC